MDLVTFNFVVAWASSAVGIVFLLLVVGYKELMVYVRDPSNHSLPCIMLFLWAIGLYFESVGWEGESRYIFGFTCSIVTISLYHNFLQMEFPDETPDGLCYLFGWAHLIVLGDGLIYEIKKNVAEIYDLSIEPSGIFNTLDQGSRDLIWLQSVGVVPIFIYYLVRYAPDRASKQRKEAKEKERVLSQRSSLWMGTKSSRGGVGGSSSRQNRWLPSNDDDINSVDGGPPSEASDDDG